MASFLQRREGWAAAALVVVFFLLNLSIASRSPDGGWSDEVVFVDPAFNLDAGKGWTSSVWRWQTDHDFWAVNCPLYSGGLYAWIKVLGRTMVAARAYCYFLSAIGVLLFWLGARRLGFLDPLYRLFWLSILSTEYAMNWMARNERYDVWIFLGLALAFVGASFRGSAARCATIFAGCFVVTCAGFLGGPYVVFMALLVNVLTRFRFWKEAIASVAGSVGGVVLVCLFYLTFGHLQAFLNAVHHNAGLGDRPFYANLRGLIFYPAVDPSLAVMIVVLAVLTVFTFRQESSPVTSRWLQFAWGVVLLMPVLMTLRGVFTVMYMYLVIIPFSLATLDLIRRAQSVRSGRWLAFALAAVMAIDCVGGLPGRLFTTLCDWRFRNPELREQFVHHYVHPGDSVLTEFAFYFDLRDYAKFIATPQYFDIPADEASRVNVALVYWDLSAGDTLGIPAFGHGWKKVAAFPTPEMTASLPHFTSYRTYTLYRRDVSRP